MTASKAHIEALNKISSLEEYVNELLDLLANKDGTLESNHLQIQRLFEENAKQTTKVFSLTKNLDEYQERTETSIRTQAAKIVSLLGAVDELRDGRFALRGEVDNLRKELALEKAKVAPVFADLKKEQEKSFALERKSNLQQGTIDDLQNHRDNLQGEIYDLKDALEVKERQRVNISDELINCRDTNDELLALYKKIQRVTGIPEDVSLAYALETMKEDLTSAEKALAIKDDLITNYEAMVINPSANDECLRNIIARQDKHINKVEQEVRDQKVTIATLQENKINAWALSQIEVLKQTVADQRSYASALLDTVKEAKEKALGYESHAATAKAKIMKMEKELMEVRGGFSEGTVAKLIEDLKQAREAIRIQDSGLNFSKQQMSKKDAQAIEDRQTIRALRGDLSTANLAINRFSITVSNLVEEKDKMEQKIKDLQSMYRGALKLAQLKQERVNTLTGKDTPSCEHPCQCGCS